MKKFPYWIIPTSLLFFVVGLLIWLAATGKLPLYNSNHSLDHKNLNELSKNNNLEISGFKPKKEIKKIDNTHKKNDFSFQFIEGLIFFKRGDYQNSALKFLNYISNISSQKIHRRYLKAKLYLSYSLLFLGLKTDKEELIERSQKYLFELFRILPSKDKLIPKTVLGLARSSRFLEEYPEEIDMILKENLIWASKNIKKHIYLELGYFYFNNNKLNRALAYFGKSGLPIADQKVYEILIEKEGSSLYLLTLLSRKMIPRYIIKDVKIKIQKKVIIEAKRLFKEEKKEEAYFLLKKLLVDFQNEPIIEQANFYLGDFYSKDMQYQKALYFYDQVLSNEYLEYDPFSLFKKGLIYYRTGNYEDAIKSFNMIRENYVTSQFYQPSLDWIKEIEKNIRKKEPILEKALEEEEVVTPKELPKLKKKPDFSDENMFLKEEIPEEEIY